MLISTVGFSINKMICLSSGKVKVAVLKDVKCGGEDEGHTEGIDERCCDFHSEYVQVDFLSAEKPLKLAPMQAAILTCAFGFACKNLPTEALGYNYSNAPPPFSGTSLLKLISVFRI
jgi:hypothetical protein